MPKITDLSAQTVPGANDVLAIVDIASATTKKITRTNLLKGAVLPNDTVTTAAIANSAVTTATIADGAVTADKVNFATGIWWEELGRSTIGGTGGNVTIEPRKYLRVMVLVTASSTADIALRFNNDTSNSYASRININGGADATQVSSSASRIFTEASGVYLSDTLVSNVSNQPKVITGETSAGSTSAVAASDRAEVSGKWVNITSQITNIAVVRTTGTGTYSSGEIVVLGHD